MPHIALGTLSSDQSPEAGGRGRGHMITSVEAAMPGSYNVPWGETSQLCGASPMTLDKLLKLICKLDLLGRVSEQYK